MAKTSHSRELSLDGYLKSLKGDTLNYNTVFGLIADALEMAQGVLITTLPRGGLQIAQPSQVSEALLRGYIKDFHAVDRPTWTAIARHQPVRALDCWSAAEFESSSYYRDFLVPNGLAFAVSAPLRAPILEGYPGALTLFRTQQQPRFTDAEL